MEAHLDLLGGMAGDMFIAALLDAFPHHEPRVLEAIDALGRGGVECSLVPHADHVLRGRRFRVKPIAAPEHHGHHDHGEHHEHTSWQSIRARLERSQLSPGTRKHALGIFRLLAGAEAFVHGIEPERVTFHEVGAWDSIADIVGAASLIDAIGATRWTASPAPLGGGRINTAHGALAVPAPATVQLLLGMPIVDDGIGGERVTPTGAAILRYLCPPPDGSGSRSRDRGQGPARPSRASRTLIASGTGFGTRQLAGVSNHLRVLCFEVHGSGSAGHRVIDVLEFEVDDQSGEDLAIGLDRLRAHQAVLDVTQTPAFGKKGRMVAHVRVLARHAHVDEVANACFQETTTIGLRHREVRAIALERRSQEVSVDGQKLRVKVVQRPGGTTAKAEADDVRHAEQSRRASVRARAKAAVLQDSRGEPGLGEPAPDESVAVDA